MREIHAFATGLKRWSLIRQVRQCPTPDAMQHCETPDKAADYWRLHIASHPHFKEE